MFTKITDFIFEINNLKRFKHCGVKFAGVKDPGSLADHIMRTCQIGYILASLEKADTLKVLEICLFHDNGEVRIGDIHRIAAQYIDSDEAESQAFEDQIKNLPAPLQQKLTGLVSKYNEAKKSKEFTVARDADLLETIFQAKEYLEMGYPLQRWIDNGEKYLRTDSAKKILKEVKKKSFIEWWTKLNIA